MAVEQARMGNGAGKAGLGVERRVWELLERAAERGGFYVNLDRVARDAVWIESVERSNGAHRWTEYTVYLPYGEISIRVYGDGEVYAEFTRPTIYVE